MINISDMTINKRQLSAVCNHRGFSLLEILIAVAIIGIVFTTVLKMHSQTIAMNDAAGFYSRAPLLAQTRLSRLQMDPDEAFDTSGGFGENFPGYTWTLEINDVELTEALGETSERLKKIDLMIARNDADTYHLRTYCLLPP